MTEVLGGNAQQKLKSLVDRIERLNEDKAAITTDLKEVFAEAKGEGFDVKIIRKVIRLRAQDAAKREEEAALVDLYMHAVQGDLFEEPPPARIAKSRTKATVQFSGGEPFELDAPDATERMAAGLKNIRKELAE